MGWNPEDHASPEVKAEIKRLDGVQRSSPKSVQPDWVRTVLGPFYKTLDVMKSARNSESKLMNVWADDMHAAEQVVSLLESMRDATPPAGEVSELLKRLEKYEEYGPLSCLALHPETPGYTTGGLLRDARDAREAIQRLSAESSDRADRIDAKDQAYFKLHAELRAAGARLAEAVAIIDAARQAIEYSIDMGCTDPAGVLLQTLNRSDAFLCPVGKDRCGHLGPLEKQP